MVVDLDYAWDIPDLISPRFSMPLVQNRARTQPTVFPRVPLELRADSLV